MRLCAGILNRLQVVLDETRHCHPLVLKVNDVVVEQIATVRVEYLIVVSSMEVTHDMEARLPEGPNDLQHLSLRNQFWSTKETFRRR